MKFSAGDHIRVSGDLGEVMEVGERYTLVRINGETYAFVTRTLHDAEVCPQSLDIEADGTVYDIEAREI